MQNSCFINAELSKKAQILQLGIILDMDLLL